MDLSHSKSFCLFNSSSLLNAARAEAPGLILSSAKQHSTYTRKFMFRSAASVAVRSAAFAPACPLPQISPHRSQMHQLSCRRKLSVREMSPCPLWQRAHTKLYQIHPVIHSSLSSKEVDKCKELARSDESIVESSSRFKTVRKVLSLISLTGAIETSYLTFNKLLSSPGAICSTQGCVDVLSGPFSTFLGIPLTLFGALAYSTFAYLCIWPLSASDEEVETDAGKYMILPADEIYASRDAATRPLMLALSTIMFVLSCYLMSLLHFVIRSMCPYCVFSAGLSAVLFILTTFGRAVPNWRNAVSIGAVSASAAGVAAALMFFVSLPAHIRAQPPSEPQSPPPITMRSTQSSLRIAGKLSLKNAKMYGAYWCSHCYDQKQRFGKKAFAKLQYIECDKYGVNTKYQLCRDKRIPGYPTWEIDGEMYPGEIDLPDLERLVDDSDGVKK